MSVAYSGRCQCGAVRFEISGEYRTTYACHCTICQHQSGSAFGMAVIVGDPVVRWTRETPSVYVREGLKGTGRSQRCAFCAKCGTRLTHQFFTDQGDMPFVSIKPGTLDDTSTVVPVFHLWTQHKQPWIRFSEGDEVWPQAMPRERMLSYMLRGRPDDA